MPLGHVPVSMTNEKEHRHRIATLVNRLIRGEIDSYFEVTLNGNGVATNTLVVDPWTAEGPRTGRANLNSYLILVPINVGCTGDVIDYQVVASLFQVTYWQIFHNARAPGAGTRTYMAFMLGS
jgi:hypothetical protein